MDKELEAVLTKIREAYAKQASLIEASTAGLEARLQEYRSAAKADLLAVVLKNNGLAADERRAEAAALALYDAIGNLPEFQPLNSEAPAVADDTSEEEPAEALEVEEASAPDSDPDVPAATKFPLLSALTKERPILLFGGYVNEEKRAWMLGLGVHNEWVSNEAGTRASGVAQRMAARLSNGEYCGLIMLNELMGHRESNALLLACRRSVTPFAMGKKGGKGQLLSLFVKFENGLAKGATLPEMSGEKEEESK